MLYMALVGGFASSIPLSSILQECEDKPISSGPVYLQFLEKDLFNGLLKVWVFRLQGCHNTLLYYVI